MKTILQLLLLLNLLAFSFVSKADGNSLLTECAAAERFIETNHMPEDSFAHFQIAHCLGVVSGVGTTLFVLAHGNLIKSCMPKDGMPNSQLVRIVNQYLRQHPEELHQEDVPLIMMALSKAYPCN